MMQKRVYFVHMREPKRASMKVADMVNYAQAAREGWRLCSLRDYKRMRVKK